MTAQQQGTLKVFVVAGEESGDQLGGKLLAALRTRLGDRLVVEGLGGRRMAEQGLASIFPLDDIAVMGVLPVLARLPTIVNRVWRTVDAVVAARPDVLVIIDSPDFTHQVAKRTRAFLPWLPVVDYVSPSVWAWRPGRARKMAAYIDHVLALLPFEPEAHRRLGGPACTYVGHPLIERLDELRPRAGERPALGEGPLRLLVLPGSRRSEAGRLLEPFGQTLELIERALPGQVEVLVPAVPHLVPMIEKAVATWPVPATIVEGEAAKLQAFRHAHAALAASGTVTLELALSAVPMVVAYKVSKLEEQLRHLITVDTVVLPNLILGEKAIPERLQWDCTPEKLAEALLPLLRETPERAAQLATFRRLDEVMTIPDDTPSARAARIVIETASLRSRPQED